jgi:hypothetical protein
MAFLSVGSTLKDSAMQDWAISMDSASSGVRVPSLREVERNSMIERARRCFDCERDWRGGWLAPHMSRHLQKGVELR